MNSTVEAIVIIIQENLEWDQNKLQDMHPLDLKKEIDKCHDAIKDHFNYLRNLLNKKNGGITKVRWWGAWDQTDLAFGKWSHNFNVILRKKIASFAITSFKEDENPEIYNLARKYKWVYAYWWNTYHMIESYKYITKLKQNLKSKNIKKGRKTLGDLIEDKTSIDKVHTQFHSLIERLNNLNYENNIITEEKENIEFEETDDTNKTNNL